MTSSAYVGAMHRTRPPRRLFATSIVTKIHVGLTPKPGRFGAEARMSVCLAVDQLASA